MAVILEQALESPGGLLWWGGGYLRVSDLIGLGGGSRKIYFSNEFPVDAAAGLGTMLAEPLFKHSYSS